MSVTMFIHQIVAMFSSKSNPMDDTLLTQIFVYISNKQLLRFIKLKSLLNSTPFYVAKLRVPSLDSFQLVRHLIHPVFVISDVYLVCWSLKVVALIFRKEAD